MAGGDLTAYIDYDTTKAKRSLDDLETKNRRTTSTIEKEWEKAGENSAKMFGPGNLLRAAFAGIGAAVGIAAAGLREYAKYSEEAAVATDRLASSRSRLLRDIGGDVVESGAADLPGDGINFLRRARYIGAAAFQRPLDALISMSPLSIPFGGGARDRINQQAGAIGGYYDATDAAVMRRAYIDRAAKAGASSAIAGGDRFAGQTAAAQSELRRIALERSQITDDDLLAGEKRRALMLEEIAAADQLNAIERERREDAERRAEAETKAADAAKRAADMAAKEQLAAMMAGERSKDSFAFQERDLRLDMMRAAGADGVDAAAINLQFDRLKYGVASDSSISPEERDSRRARLDELRAERLALLGMESPEEAVRMRSFARPGAISSGFAGVTSIYRQAFAPPGATGPDPVKQISTDVRQILRSVQGGQTARLG